MVDFPTRHMFELGQTIGPSFKQISTLSLVQVPVSEAAEVAHEYD
jgi:hypothetical protein